VKKKKNGGAGRSLCKTEIKIAMGTRGITKLRKAHIFESKQLHHQKLGKLCGEPDQRGGRRDCWVFHRSMRTVDGGGGEEWSGVE